MTDSCEQHNSKQVIMCQESFESDFIRNFEDE